MLRFFEDFRVWGCGRLGPRRGLGFIGVLCRCFGLAQEFQYALVVGFVAR